MQLSIVQIRLVKESWGIFRCINPAVVGDAFYTRLFYTNPALKKMFRGSMPDQYAKLTAMLTAIVSRLERLHELDHDLQLLAMRHVEYGVKKIHYKAVGDALLWMLEKGLGNDWTGEMANAWYACYQQIADVMIHATANGTSTNTA